MVLGETLIGPPLTVPPVLKLVPVDVVESAQDQLREVDSPWIMLALVVVKEETEGLLEIVAEDEHVFDCPSLEVTVTVPFLVPLEE